MGCKVSQSDSARCVRIETTPGAVALPLAHSWLAGKEHTTVYQKHPSIPIIKELRSSLSFTTRDYNDIAQVLDLMFPRLVSIRPYSDADENEPYWKDHWWFIEHLRLMYKELRMYRPVH